MLHTVMGFELSVKNGVIHRVSGEKREGHFQWIEQLAFVRSCETRRQAGCVPVIKGLTI